jgi:hypothetical protein
MMSASHTSVECQGFFTHHRTSAQELLVASWHWPMATARPHSHSLIWSFSFETPFLNILQSTFNVDVFAHPRSRPPSQLSFPAHHLRSLKSSHWESSRTILLLYSDCSEFVKGSVLKELASPPPHFPFLPQPNDQHVYLLQLPRYPC